MTHYRMISVITLSMLFFVCVFSSQAFAKTPKALITSTGKSIPYSDTRNRLSRLLRELGEPSWTRKELNRLSKTVHAYLNAFSGRQFDKTLEALMRGDRYRPMIRAKLASAKIPLAFQALPMAESAYRFNARSRAGARGLWQFMPASARHYGLHVGRKLDERTDPARSTDAAVKYLKFLNRKFGKISILLSVAAYNAGEGRIAGVVRRSGIKSGKRGYSRVIRYLPKETRGYVPEFLAAALLVKDPGHFGFPVSRKRTHHYVQLRDPLSVKKIAQLTKLPLTKVQQLNPELKKFSRTPANNFMVRLPANAALRLDNKLAKAKVKVWKPVSNPISLTSTKRKTQIASRKSSTHTTYKVHKGNNLGGIAKMFAVPIQDLRKRNNIQGNRIHIGQSLIIPGKKKLDRKIYRVRPGDNLGLIAQRLGVPIQHLKFANGVTNPRRLRPGQKLVYYV